MNSKLRAMSLKAYGQESLSKIASIVTYESGDVLRDTIRMEDYPDIASLYKSQAKVSLGDVLAMTQLFCDLIGWDFEEIHKLGCERAIERCKEKLEGKDGF